MPTVEKIKHIIRENNLYNWFEDYPWLTGFIGDENAAIWFIGENPSLTGVKAVDKRSIIKTENLQWNSHDGDRLLREAITEAGLKSGDPETNQDWNCYITNAIKEPEIVGERNEKKRDSQYWKIQAERWLPVLQQQINAGKPKVLVALGGQSYKIINYMKRIGLRVPKIEKIHHYSYIMMRPEAGTRRGPRHPDRIAEFKYSIKALAERYS
jgi:uracil-DNA glycosylase